MKCNKIYFLLNKIRECYDKINEHGEIDSGNAISLFEARYESLSEECLDNIIKANGFSFYTSKEMKEVA